MKKYLLVGIMILAGGVAKAQYPAGIWFTEHSLNMLFSQDSDNQGGVVGVEDSLKVGWDGSIWRTIFTREDTSLYLKNIPGSGGTLGVSSTGGVYEISGGAAETDPYSLHLDQTSAQTVTGGKPNFSGGINVNNNFSISTSGDFNEYGNETPGVGYVLVGDGTQMKMVFDPRMFTPQQGLFSFSEFTASSIIGGGDQSVMSSHVSGAGATSTTSNTIATAVSGQWDMQTGTTTTGRSQYFSTNNIAYYSGVTVAETSVYIEDLSTVAEEFSVIFGFHGANNLDAYEGIYFKYNRLNHGNFWVATKAILGTPTNNVTAVAVAADTWYVLRLEIDCTNNRVKYYINGSLAYTESTSVSSAACPLKLRILKSAGSTTRFIYSDYYWMWLRFYTPLTSRGIFSSISGY